MSLLSDVLSTFLDRRHLWRPARGVDPRDDAALIADLLSTAGEVSGSAAARELLDRYEARDDEGRVAFFGHLAERLALDPAALRAALDAYEAAPGPASYGALLAAATPPRQALVRRLNLVPGATARLVAMRADLLRLLDPEDPRALLDRDFRQLFQSWFDRGFLELRRVSWASPAQLLDRIIAHATAHPIADWEALRHRVEPPDRRCFAFFHPAMPAAPLLFVEVALTRGMPGSVQALLARDRARVEPAEADTAVLYAISECQPGLRGISFGHALIGQVLAELSAELPGLSSFTTLSPMPGLRGWLQEEGIDPTRLDDEALRRRAAQYLLGAQRPNGRPRDPVARFHLANGAQLQAIHANADISARGRAESCGAMASYLYDPPRIAQNHEGYATRREIAAAEAVRGLLPRGERSRKEGA